MLQVSLVLVVRSYISNWANSPVLVTEAGPSAFANIEENYYYVFVVCSFFFLIVAYLYFP